jgi:hypothetical protein
MTGGDRHRFPSAASLRSADNQNVYEEWTMAVPSTWIPKFNLGEDLKRNAEDADNADER